MKAKKKSPDWWIFFSVMVLLVIGIIMVFSSSQYFAQYDYDDAFYFLKKQGESAILGLIAMFVLYKIDYHVYKKLAWPAFITVCVLLSLIAFGGSGDEAGGATRWIIIAGFRFQPSELAKLGLIVLMSKILSEKQDVIKTFSKGFLPQAALVGVTCALVFLQNHLSATVIIAGTAFILMFCAGINWLYLGITVGVGFAGACAAVLMTPFRMGRILAYLDPWQDPLGDGFQTVQSLLAIGSGGLTGVGLGSGGSKWFYLPERHTDFIFSVLSEELGFIGAFFVILLFMLFIWRGLTISVHMPDTFGSFLALGITAMIGLQAFINLGVVTGLLPVTGVTLPFVSYGGTSLIVCLMSVGILLNLSRYAEIKR